MTMTNNSLHTASMTNNAIMSQADNVTWNDADYTWNEARGTWDKPYGIRNNAINTASMTNNAIS